MWSRSASGVAAAGLDRAGPHDDGLALAPGHDREAEPCHAGVDPEHAGIEHLFVQSRVAGGAEQSLAGVAQSEAMISSEMSKFA